jgi:hypothetical protein
MVMIVRRAERTKVDMKMMAAKPMAILRNVAMLTLSPSNACRHEVVNEPGLCK